MQQQIKMIKVPNSPRFIRLAFMDRLSDSKPPQAYSVRPWWIKSHQAEGALAAHDGVQLGWCIPQVICCPPNKKWREMGGCLQRRCFRHANPAISLSLPRRFVREKQPFPGRRWDEIAAMPLVCLAISTNPKRYETRTWLDNIPSNTLENDPTMLGSDPWALERPQICLSIRCTRPWFGLWEYHYCKPRFLPSNTGVDPAILPI